MADLIRNLEDRRERARRLLRLPSLTRAERDKHEADFYECERELNKIHNYKERGLRL